MGSINERVKKGGLSSFTAQIRVKRDGFRHTEARTFSTRKLASRWMALRENELDRPGVLEKIRNPDPTLGEVIDLYLKTTLTPPGRTKAQCLVTVKKHPIAARQCGEITSIEIAGFITDMINGWQPVDHETEPKPTAPRKPQTVANYVSHLRSVFAVARPMWGYALDQQALRDAVTAAKYLGMIAASAKRERRPSLDELEQLLEYFAARKRDVPRMAPMVEIVLFCLFSTRRQEEATTLLREDYEAAHGRILVRGMKHPAQKIGNDVWCELPPEAIAVIESIPQNGERIFPFNHRTISANFTRACHSLQIKDLHFHDLRHEGVSRLFEMGKTIPQAASVSGHRSWSSLKRYSHLRQPGDKYAGWDWRRWLA